MSNWEIILKYHNREFVIWFKVIALALGLSCCSLPPPQPSPPSPADPVTSGSMKNKPPSQNHVLVADVFNIFTNLSL